jgi:hypothetical protein
MLIGWPSLDFNFGECLDLAVVTQGKTLGELKDNLQESLAFYLKGEDFTG